MKLYEAISIAILIFICVGIVLGVGQTIYDVCKSDDFENVHEELNEKKNE